MVTNPGETFDSTIAGTLLFRQSEDDEHIRIFGSLHMDVGLVELDEGQFKEWRGMGITENAFDGSECDNNGEIYNPFGAEYSNLNSAKFSGVDGGACYHYGRDDTQTTLWGDNSVLGRSVSLYESTV